MNQTRMYQRTLIVLSASVYVAKPGQAVCDYTPKRPVCLTLVKRPEQ